MAEEETPQDEFKQENHSVSSLKTEEQDKEEAEKDAITSAGTGDEKSKEEDVQLETGESDAEVSITEEEPKDEEISISLEEKPASLDEDKDEVSEKVTEEEAIPTPMPASDDQEENIVAQESESKETEKVEETIEEAESKGEGGEKSEIEVGEVKGEDEGEGEGKTQGEEKKAGEVLKDKEETPISIQSEPRELQETDTPRQSIDIDNLTYDPTFATSRFTDFTERIHIISRKGSSQMTGEEESKSTTSSEETTPEEDEAPPIDRQPYLELYANLIKQKPLLKMKNNFLQRKMAEYFKSRKMEHVLRESDRLGDAEAKYFKKLDDLWELRNMNNLQREAITQELNDMRETRNNQLASVTMNFEQMLAREREIGTGLIYTKTAKEIPEKFLERLLKNQSLKSKEIEDMRLAYIRIRDAVNEVQAKIKAMDKIGENFNLIDYEQLKMENQSHADKIEERDAELEKLRLKYSADIQCLAHFREKSTNTNIEIEEMNDKFSEIEIDRNNCREKVNALKQERDALRSEILKLRDNSGLLTKPKLLFDLQETLDMVMKNKQELDEVKDQFAKNTVMLEALRKNLDEEKGVCHVGKSNLKERKKVVKHKTAYPSLERFNATKFEEDSNTNK